MKKHLVVTLLMSSFLFFSCQKQETKPPESMNKETKTKDNVLTKEKQTGLTSDEIIQQFKDGNDRFLKGVTMQEDYLMQVEHTGKEGQFPKAIVLSCIDSRGPVEVICDKGIGDVFNTRVAGNYADLDVIGGIEYACKVVGTKVIIVMGHTDCGAIKSACDNVKLGNITEVMNMIMPAVDSVKGFDNNRNSKNKDFVNAVAKKNVELTSKKILANSKILSDLVIEGNLKIVGAIYNVSTGKIDFLNN